MHSHSRVRGQQSVKSTGVIAVAVGQHHRVDLAGVDSQDLHVVHEDLAVGARVEEQQLWLVPADQAGEAP